MLRLEDFKKVRKKRIYLYTKNYVYTKIDLNSIAKYLQYRGMNGNDIDLDSFVVHCVPEKWYLPEFWTKWSQWSAILWHCLLSNCLLKDHNRSKLTRLSDWKMTVDAELEV